MAKGPIRQTDIAMCEVWKLLTGLARRVEHITFQHVFSHCGLEFNDKADTLAKQGATKPQTAIPTHVRDVITLAKRYYRSKFHNNIDNTNERILRAGTTCYLNKEKTWNRAKAKHVFKFQGLLITSPKGGETSSETSSTLAGDEAVVVHSTAPSAGRADLLLLLSSAASCRGGQLLLPYGWCLPVDEPSDGRSFSSRCLLA